MAYVIDKSFCIYDDSLSGDHFVISVDDEGSVELSNKDSSGKVIESVVFESGMLDKVLQVLNQIKK